MVKATNLRMFSLMIAITLLMAGCQEPVEIPQREDLIPSEAIKMSPENDPTPPKLYSDEFTDPEPLPYPVNTRGAEDSAFVTPDGMTLYVWFTPNNRMDVIEQSQDLVTGIYQFKKAGDGWQDLGRVWLVEPGKPHLDGCGFFLEDKVWICGVREGIAGIEWFTSDYIDGSWSQAALEEFDPAYEVGELHISRDRSELYFHSSRSGGKGGLDIWMSSWEDGAWGPPMNLENVNSEFDEGWPALNPAEDELWITKNYGIWRSKKVDGVWGVPEEVVGALAGEATIDRNGNVYFTHHYYENDVMIEADIYVIRRK